VGKRWKNDQNAAMIPTTVALVGPKRKRSVERASFKRLLRISWIILKSLVEKKSTNLDRRKPENPKEVK